MPQLKIEVGKKYKTRDGRVILIKTEDNHPVYPFRGQGLAFTTSGVFLLGVLSNADLIEEVKE